MRNILAERHDWDATKDVFVEAFAEAVQNQDMIGFREICGDLLANPPTPFCVPYAFAYEARSWLHDPQMWELREGRPGWHPRPELLRALDQCLERPAAINARDNYYWPIIAGLRHCIVGDQEAGFVQLARAASYPDFYRVVRCDLGGGAAFARTYPTEAELDHCHATSQFSTEALFARVFAGRPRLVISTAFDRVYAQAFGAAWIESVAKLQGQGIGLHFHLMFRGKADQAMIATLEAAASALGVDLAMSIDTDITQSNAYFASARFIKAKAFLRAFEAPLLLVDADSFIPDHRRFSDVHLPQLLGEQRVMGLLTDGPWNGYLPWRRFSATWLFCPNREDAGAFLSRTADAVAYFWDPRGCNWWIDQMALEIGRRSVCATRPAPPRFGDVFAELPGLLESGEAYKKSRIAAIPEIRSLMEAGKSYWQAVEAFGRS